MKHFESIYLIFKNKIHSEILSRPFLPHNQLEVEKCIRMCYFELALDNIWHMEVLKTVDLRLISPKENILLDAP